MSHGDLTTLPAKPKPTNAKVQVNSIEPYIDLPEEIKQGKAMGSEKKIKKEEKIKKKFFQAAREIIQVTNSQLEYGYLLAKYRQKYPELKKLTPKDKRPKSLDRNKWKEYRKAYKSIDSYPIKFIDTWYKKAVSVKTSV